MENFKWKLNRWRKEWEIILSFKRKLNGKINTINVSLFEKKEIYIRWIKIFEFIYLS